MNAPNQPRIPAVKFADADMMAKMGLPQAPSQFQNPAPQSPITAPQNRAPMPTMPQMPAMPQMPTMPQMPAMPQTPAGENMFNFADSSSEQAPTTNPFVDGPGDPVTPPMPSESGAQIPQPNVPSDQLPVDSPENSFSIAYASLTKVQKDIVDTMASMLRFEDLFQHKRFSLKFTLIPGKLQAHFVSMTAQESEQFWLAFRDTKMGRFELELLMNLYRCAFSITHLNGSEVGQTVEARLNVFRAFDSSMIQTLAVHVSLFEIAKLKVLYQNFLTVRGA